MMIPRQQKLNIYTLFWFRSEHDLIIYQMMMSVGNHPMNKIDPTNLLDSYWRQLRAENRMKRK